MRWIRRLLIATLLLALALIAFLGTAPDPQPEGPVGQTLAARGPHAVRELELQLEDRSRATPAGGDRPARASRALRVDVWLPEGAADAPYPVVLYAHGFMGLPDDNERLARHLASRGFAVAAPEFPLTSYRTPGDADMHDLPEQPRDVSFVLDELLARGAELHLDSERIGVIGLSLGGMTTALVTFHPRLRDPRVRASVSIAGPSSMFSKSFFRTAPAPYLMIAGDIDAIVDYTAHAQGLPQRAAGATLVTLSGGTHIGFSDVAGLLFRWLDNPDALACWMLDERTPASSDFMAPLGGEAEGIAVPSEGPRPCTRLPLPRAMRPARQQLLARLAITAFLEEHLAGRGEARAQLRALAAENPDLRLDQPSQERRMASPPSTGTTAPLM